MAELPPNSVAKGRGVNSLVEHPLLWFDLPRAWLFMNLMKKCGYCGREDLTDAFCCQECGTSFEQEPPGNFCEALKSSLSKSPIGAAIATGLGVFLISTGVYCAAGRMSVERSSVVKNPFSPGEPLYESRQIISYSLTEHRILTLAIIVFTIAVCWMRFQKRWQAILVAAVTLGVMVTVRLLPAGPVLVPAFTIGMTLDSPVALYIAAAFQTAIGILLLFLARPVTS